AVAYRYQGEVYEEFPPHQTIFHKCEPIYEELAGWSADITDARTFTELPDAAQAYIRRIEELSGTPVTLVSVGPSRDQTVRREPIRVGA
ncbi:MAG: adenylosuccinate synthetase, partial [Actinomycetota bacterium]